MQEALSVEGLLLQARRVMTARWPGLLAVGVCWAIAAWTLYQARYWLPYNRLPGPGGPAFYLLLLAIGLIQAIGAGLMIGIVVRTGQARRPLSGIARHALIALCSILAVSVVYGLGLTVLIEGARYLSAGDEEQPGLLAYGASFLPLIYQFGLFALLGMTIPAAMERPVAPWTAAAVALKLSAGQRRWLLIIAIVGAAAVEAPAYGVALLVPGRRDWFQALLTVGQMLAALGTGVLYLELRRIRKAVSPIPAAET